MDGGAGSGQDPRRHHRVYFGPRNQVVRDAVENTLLAVQQGKLEPADAWAKAVKDAQQAAK